MLEQYNDGFLELNFQDALSAGLSPRQVGDDSKTLHQDLLFLGLENNEADCPY